MTLRSKVRMLGLVSLAGTLLLVSAAIPASTGSARPPAEAANAGETHDTDGLAAQKERKEKSQSGGERAAPDKSLRETAEKLSRVQWPTSNSGQCPPDRKLDLSGSYTGLFISDKLDKEGTPAEINIIGGRIELNSESVKASGTIAALNSCGDTSVAVRFKEAQGSDLEIIDQLLKTGISLDARFAGIEHWQAAVKSFKSDKAIVLATAQGENGQMAGADVAFIICPEYPACKKYRRCPCPEPQK